MDKIKQQSRWLWLLLSLLLALAVLLGAVQAFGVREDPRQAMTRGLCVRTNESWQMDTECRAEYVIPADAGEGLMLSIRTVKKSFALALCGPDGVENWFYEYQQKARSSCGCSSRCRMARPARRCVLKQKPPRR